MLDDLAERYRPFLHMMVDHCDAYTQDLLRACINQALNGIESICPVAMLPLPHGLATAYGPTQKLADAKTLILAATAEKYFVFGVPRPIQPRDVPPGHGPSEVWQAIVDGVKEERGDWVFNGLCMRITEDRVAQFKELAKRQRRDGFVPLFVVLCHGRDGQCGGLTGMVPLPQTIEAQLAAAERAAP